MSRRFDTYHITNRDINKLRELIAEKYDNIQDFLLYGEMRDAKINELMDEIYQLKQIKKGLYIDISNMRNDIVKLKRENGRLRTNLKKFESIDKSQKIFNKSPFNKSPFSKSPQILTFPRNFLNLLQTPIEQSFTSTFGLKKEEEIKQQDEPMTEETKEKLSKIFNLVNSIEDILKLEEIKDNFSCSVKFKKLIKLIPALKCLNKMVGLDKIKKQIFEHICYFIQGLETKNEIMNIVISGGPGVGKSELGKIIGEIYLALGFLKNNKFVVAKRSDFIGKYLGHTASQTQEIINKAIGGVLFIDEVYSLGEKEQRDSFSKECIDTINQNLIEHKGELLCIIAGYEKNIQECFFNYNPGLDRRFPIHYNIDGYTSSELREIFMRKLDDWTIDDPVHTATLEFFEKNKDNFPYYGGDVELLIQNAKFIASKRLMKDTIFVTTKCFTQNDLNNAIELSHISRNKKDSAPEWMYG
jgi:hypothetical protein